MANLIIDSMGTFQGGEFERVDIDGIVTINGDITATSFDNDGMLTVNGSVTAGSIDCDGTATINGAVNAQSLEIDGMVTIHGPANFKDGDIDGIVTINGTMGAETVRVDGTLTVEGIHCNDYSGDGIVTVKRDIKCEKFTTSGVFTVKGSKFEGNEITGDGVISAANAQISADTVDFEGKINASEIVGETVTVRSVANGIPFLKRKIFSSKAGLIEATNISLHGVTAGEVNGCNIELGKHCEIGKLDCSGELRIHPTSTVGQITGNYRMI